MTSSPSQQVCYSLITQGIPHYQHTLGPAYNEQKDAKETARYKWVLLVTELFNMAVNDFDAKQSARYSRVLVVTELVLSGTQCNVIVITAGMLPRMATFLRDAEQVASLLEVAP